MNEIKTPWVLHAPQYDAEDEVLVEWADDALQRVVYGGRP